MIILSNIKRAFYPNMFVFLCAFLSLANIPPHKHSAMAAEVAGRGWCGWDCENILIKSMSKGTGSSSGNARLTWRSIEALTHIHNELLKLMIFNFFHKCHLIMMCVSNLFIKYFNVAGSRLPTRLRTLLTQIYDKLLSMWLQNTACEKDNGDGDTCVSGRERGGG